MIKELRTSLLTIITKTLGLFETDKTVAKATFIDPRFKKTAFCVDVNATKVQEWITGKV